MMMQNMKQFNGGTLLRRDVWARSDHNRLGMNYRAQAGALPWAGDIWDIHTHLQTMEGARVYFEVARLYGVTKTWTMSPLSIIDELQSTYAERVAFIAVPDFMNFKKNPQVFTSGWLKDIETYAAKGVKICKFWCAPRGRDLHPALLIDSAIRKEAMALAASLGMMFMMHIGDPDTWFATHYKDSRRYGTKRDQYVPLERLLDQHGDTPLIAAHLGGTPENLDFLQGLLDRHPNLYLDSSATKWMVRELSKQPERFKAFLEANPGRVCFGSDIVANDENLDFDLYASRYWALREMFETGYRGASPIADPDLHLIDPSVATNASPMLCGMKLEPSTLGGLYQYAAANLTGLD